MTWLLKLLAGRFGAWIASGFAVLVVVLSVSLWVQTDRLSSARKALVNPLTGKTWQFEALRDARDLATCRGNTERLQGSLERQNAAVESLQATGRTLTAENERLASAAQKSASAASSAQARILSRPPAGNDTCSRVADVDATFLKELSR